MDIVSTPHENRVVSPENLVKQLHWRYATKMFDPAKKISADDWKALEEALVLTPSSFGLQPWKFFVVTDPGKKEKLLAASWNQRQIVECSHLVVFAIVDNLDPNDIEKYIRRIVEVRGVKPETLEKFRHVMVNAMKNMGSPEAVNAWATKQIYIALGNFMTSAAVLGIDTCPMEGLVPEKYDEILELKEKGYKTIVVGVAGYRSASDKYASIPKVRFKAENVIEHI